MPTRKGSFEARNRYHAEALTLLDEPPHYIKVGSAKQRQRWEEEIRLWSVTYGEAQARREAEERKRMGVDSPEEPLTEDEFLALLKSL